MVIANESAIAKNGFQKCHCHGQLLTQPTVLPELSLLSSLLLPEPDLLPELPLPQIVM